MERLSCVVIGIVYEMVSRRAVVSRIVRTLMIYGVCYSNSLI